MSKFAMYDPATGRITRMCTMPEGMDPVPLNGEQFVAVGNEVNDVGFRIDGGVAVAIPVTAVFAGFAFTYAGKQIALDEGSRLRMACVTGVVALTGAMPAGWSGTWPAVDGATIAVPDVAAWRDFFSAMVAQVV